MSPTITKRERCLVATPRSTRARTCFCEFRMSGKRLSVEAFVSERAVAGRRRRSPPLMLFVFPAHGVRPCPLFGHTLCSVLEEISKITLEGASPDSSAPKTHPRVDFLAHWKVQKELRNAALLSFQIEHSFCLCVRFLARFSAAFDRREEGLSLFSSERGEKKKAARQALFKERE